MTDETEAITAVARASERVVDFAQSVGRAIDRYLGGPITQVSNIIEDRLRYMRWERSVRLLDRADEFLLNRELNGPTRPVPMQLLLPLMESGSLEENDEMQDRWAAMLANAADLSFDIEIRRAYVSILENLTSLDAQNLEAIYSTNVVADLETPVFTASLPIQVTEFQEENDRPLPEVIVSLGNLSRLGLITTAMAWGGYQPYGCVHRTALGTEFLRAISNQRNDA